MFHIQTHADSTQMLQQNSYTAKKKKKYKMQVFKREDSDYTVLPIDSASALRLGRRAKSVLLSALVSLEEALKHGGGVRGPGLLVLDGFL